MGRAVEPEPPPVTACQNCGRDLTGRECGDPQHRAARGCEEDPNPMPAEHRQCIKCFRVKPQAQFWNGKTRVLYKSCNQCRYLARKQRPSKLRKQAAWRVEKAAIEAFWSEQALR